MFNEEDYRVLFDNIKEQVDLTYFIKVRIFE